MRRLLINADDFGANPQRTHGIFQCVEFGVVRSVSVLPNMADSDAAAKHAKERKVSAGLHLNLTEEYPLSKPEDLPTLVEMNGLFHDRTKLHQALEEGKVEKASIEREVRAQVEWMFDNYGAPTHVDSHHHVHVYPLVAEALIPILERYGIRFVRIPLEEPLPPFGYEVPAARLERTRDLNVKAAAARDLYAASGILFPDHFRGATLVGNFSLENLRHVIAKLPEGTTELMVHPGSPIAYGTPFDLDPQRQTELRALLDESIPALLMEKKVELVSYEDL
jgi:predicted glycoside hydrolase/deacetylase ChbG (UPF0249 family)